MEKHSQAGRPRPVNDDNGRQWLRPAALLTLPVILALLIGLFFAPGTVDVSQAQGQPVVRCEPVKAVGPVEQPLEVDIFIENVENLYGADIRLSFDTTIAQIVDADPNTPDTQILPLDEFLQPDFLLRQVGDNDAGTIWYAASQVNPTEPATGSGPLARITFQAVKAGSFEMPFTYQLLADKEGFEFDASVVDCQVTFFQINDDLSVYLPVVVAR